MPRTARSESLCESCESGRSVRAVSVLHGTATRSIPTQAVVQCASSFRCSVLHSLMLSILHVIVSSFLCCITVLGGDLCSVLGVTGVPMCVILHPAGN